MENNKRRKFSNVRNRTSVRSGLTASCGPDQFQVRPESTAPATPTNDEAAPEPLLNTKGLNAQGGAGGDEFLYRTATEQELPPSPPPIHIPESNTPNPLRAVCEKWGIDRAGEARLVGNCREAVSDCTEAEIAYFADTLARKKRAEGDTRPLSGILIVKTAEVLETGIAAYRRPPLETDQAPELPPPCPKCRPLGGRVLKEHIQTKGLRAGETYKALVDCDCLLGQTLKAGFQRHKAEAPKRSLDFAGFEGETPDEGGSV